MSWEQAVGRAVQGESPKIPDMALLRSLSVAGAMGRSAPNPRDEPAVTEAVCAGWCCYLDYTVTRAKGSRLLQPQVSGSWLCSLRVVETELVLLPGESSCIFIFHCFLVAARMFYPFPNRFWETCSLSQAFSSCG